jgi:hypothetical protein
MNFPRRSLSVIAAVVVSTALVSCGEMAVRVKGRLLDAEGNPRKNCLVTVLYRNQTAGEFWVSGKFDETAVLRPPTPDPVTVSGSCFGTRAAFEKEISRGPQKVTTIDFGDVVLP